MLLLLLLLLMFLVLLMQYDESLVELFQRKIVVNVLLYLVLLPSY